MERIRRNDRLPNWLILGVEGTPIQPGNLQTGVRVLLQVDVPAGQPLALEIPIMFGPEQHVVTSMVELKFNPDGSISNVRHQNPFLNDSNLNSIGSDVDIDASTDADTDSDGNDHVGVDTDVDVDAAAEANLDDRENQFVQIDYELIQLE